MSTTPWTMARFVRWRLRNLAPCCFACRFPIDDEPEHGICHSKPPLPILRNNTMAFEAKRKLSRHRKRNATRGVKPAGSSQAEANNGGKDMDVSRPVESSRSDEDSNWSNSLDEDYIIFSFREDGNFEVLNNDKTDEPSNNRLDHTTSRNSRPVNRKLNYERNTKTVLIERCSNIEETNYPTNYGDCINSPQKEVEEEENNNNLDVESVSGANFEECRVASTKSRDSSHSSSASTGSFAFPALRWEWSGSPERMPNSEGLPFRKHKARCVGFQCCRF